LDEIQKTAVENLRRLQGQIGFFPGSYISINAGQTQKESLQAQDFA